MHFVIAGKMNCPQFVYATMIAQRLKENLPQFTYLRISKKAGDWENWLSQTCKENEWYHMQSPIIWREISMTKGKKHYVGDITKFIDLCQDHYGLSRAMLTGELFDKSEMDWFTRRSEAEYFEDVKLQAKARRAYRCRQVCILGAGCKACDVLVMELLHIPLQNRENGMEIRLYDEPRKEKKLRAIAADVKHCLGYSGLGACRVATSIKEALNNVDLVIVLDSFPRRVNESLVKWLKRNRNAMCMLGNALNKYARTHCRVIIGSPSNQPICYNATVLASVATKLHVRNIVAVTQDLGRETLTQLAQRAKVELKDLYCPPVWGFVGLNKCVDLRHTLYNYAYKVPGPRISVNLSQGTEEMEVRAVDSLITDEDVNKIFMSVVNHKVETMPRLGRPSQLAKITAILDLLKVWGLKQEDGGGEILSLGVYSDGTFGIPEGLYWSQPVTLEKGFWRPFAKYPIPRRLDINIHNFFILGLASIKHTGVKLRKQRDRPPAPKEKKAEKFDVEVLRKGLKIPVVRLASECLEWLKRLAREELDLDVDAVQVAPTIAEEPPEPPPAEVPPEKLYCECWRREILTLRRMASEWSSTTEVEVDLSENLSGSEFSVVNPSVPYVESRTSASRKVGETGTPGTETETSSGSVVCDCGEDCCCLDVQGEGSEKSGEKAEEEVSNAEYYKRQDARVFVQEDVQPAVYEDTVAKKVKFDPQLGPCAGKSKRKFKFYGTKEALVDEEKRAEMRRRIRRYEGQGDEKEAEEEEEGSGSSVSSVGTGDVLSIGPRFHVSIDGGYEIVGDPDGLEALEELRRSPVKDSTEGFAEMWTDKVIPSLHILSSDSASQSTSLDVSQAEMQRQSRESVRQAEPPADAELSAEDYGERGEFVVGEDDAPFRSSLEAIPEADTEEEHDVDTPQEVTSVRVGSEKSVEPPPPPPQVPKRKWEGVPKCCLCHCIVPEGELGCHCGERRVMEVFKKPSTEVVPESEEEFSIRVESEPLISISAESIPEPPKVESRRKGDKRGKEEKEEEEAAAEEPQQQKKGRDIFSLPPESFFPFSPKPINRFAPSERPPELCPRPQARAEGGLPPECLEMMEEAKERALEEMRLESGRVGRSLSVEYELDFELRESEVFKERVPPARPVENWRTTLMNKYRAWFESNQTVRDELYYDMAVEEVSEDECEVDRELSQYFEK